MLQQNLRRLRRAGLPLSAIVVGGEVMQVIDSLECGDELVVLCVGELSPQAARQKALLSRIADRGVTFRPLDKAGAEPMRQLVGRLGNWLRRMGLRRSALVRTQAPMPQMSEELKIRVMVCLKPYYQLKKNVEAICAKAEIAPSTLYLFLKEYHLPSRLEVKADPLINPLKQPGFPQNILSVPANSEQRETTTTLCNIEKLPTALHNRKRD